MTTPKLIRVLLIDSQDLERHALGAVLKKERDMKLIGEEVNTAALASVASAKLAPELKPDVIVLASGLSKQEGIKALRQVAAALPKTKILAVSQHADSPFVVRMLHAGASGYMLVEGAFEELARAIRTVVKNRTYVSPGIAGIARERNNGIAPSPNL